MKFIQIILKPRQELLLLLLSLVPLFLANIKGDHGWGGDFAQYINQAIHIVKGIPLSETGYVLNENHLLMAPATYPVGFSLMLAPVYAVFGNSMYHFVVFMSLIFCLVIVFGFYYLRLYFSFGYALVASLFLAYTPVLVNFKDEVLSDVPFAGLLVLFFLIFNKRENSWWRIIGLGLGIALLILTRTVGVVIIPAIVCYAFYYFILQRSGRASSAKRPISPPYMALSLGIVLVFFAHWLFPRPSGGYTDLLETGNIFGLMKGNLQLYLQAFIDCFKGGGEASYLSLAISGFFLAASCIGFFIQLYQRIRLEEIFVGGYILVLLLFPTNQGYRFLLPIFPFCLYYSLLVVHFVFAVPKGKIKPGLQFMAIAIIFSSLLAQNIVFEKKRKYDIDQFGPLGSSFQEACQYLKGNTEEDALVAFFKPRVLSLYSSKRSISNYYDLDRIKPKFIEKSVDYLLIYEGVGLTNKPLEEHVEKHKDEMDLVWRNKRFLLYGVRYKNE